MIGSRVESPVFVRWSIRPGRLFQIVSVWQLVDYNTPRRRKDRALGDFSDPKDAQFPLLIARTDPGKGLPELPPATDQTTRSNEQPGCSGINRSV